MFLIELFGVKTNLVKPARNLGVIFDNKFTFLSHISVVCSSCLYHMQDLQCIRHYLDLICANLLAAALVCSRLDYGNSLVYGILDTDLTKLQCVRNRLISIVTKSPTFTPSVLLVLSLDWLPVKFRILFKISFLTC